MLRAPSTQDIPEFPGDMFVVYVKLKHDKRGKWSSPGIVLNVNRSSWTVTVPSTRGNTKQAAIQDVPPARNGGSLVSYVRDALNGLDDDLSAVLYPSASFDSPPPLTAKPGDPTLPVHALSYEESSENTATAGIGESHADHAAPGGSCRAAARTRLSVVHRVQRSAL